MSAVKISKDYVDKTIYLAGIGYENKPEEIIRCCDPWIGHIDGMIWGDGRFDFYDSPNDYSTTGWLDAAEKRYKDKCNFIGYQYSGNQIDKRQMYLDIAGKNKVDYLIIADTEEYIDPKYNDFEKFYSNLLLWSQLTKDRMFYQFVYIPSNKVWDKQGNKFASNKWLPSPKIHKDPGSMRFCCDRHYIWCNKKTTDEKLYRWQLKNGFDKTNILEYQPHHTVDGVRVRMDRRLRSKEVNEKTRHWAFMNEHLESSRQFYKIADIEGKIPPPKGFKSWGEYEKIPHTFDEKTGKRIDL